MSRFLIVMVILFSSLSVFAQGISEIIPEPMPLVDEGGQDIIHIMLMGSATENGDRNPGLTDSLMVVSINRTAGHVAMVSIPRDLYVYVPNIGMKKINQAYFIAERQAPGTGIETLRQTIIYNLGLEIDYYARVDFSDFSRLIDRLGGINIAVDCAIRDWRLIEPDLDKDDPDNWEMFTLWSGLHHMDGDTALWYVRSRRTSSDLDRNRRQQDVLRALWRRIRGAGILNQLPTLWRDYQDIVETDLSVGDAITMLPLAVDLEAGAIEYFTFQLNREIRNGYEDTAGRFIFIPDREAIATLMQTVVAPPNSNRLSASLPTVAVYNGSGINGMDYVAAQRLEREGFQTFVTGEWARPRNYNLVVDYTGGGKDSPIATIQDVLGVSDEGIQIEPSAERTYDFAVYIGATYPQYSCTFPVEQPLYEPDAESE